MVDEGIECISLKARFESRYPLTSLSNLPILTSNYINEISWLLVEHPGEVQMISHLTQIGYALAVL